MNHKSLFPSTLAFVALATLANVGSARAVVYTESGDAGQTLGTAAITGFTAGGSGGSALTGISGIISGSPADADLYQFSVSAANPTFSAIANGGTSSAGSFPIDTALFLFDLNGRALFANNDQSGTSYQGALTGITLAPGTYYLGISLSGNEPVNSANQLLFATSDTSTTVRGPASGLNPATLGTFNGNTAFAETGTYSITITAVPEPSTWALLGTGALALGVVVARRNRQTTVGVV